jgi:hypothetical protein
MKLPAWLAPNRIAVYVGVLVPVVGAIVALITEIDPAQGAALAAAVIAIEAAIVKFLEGWQKWEARLAPAASLAGLPTTVAAELQALRLELARVTAAAGIDSTPGLPESQAKSPITSPTP